MLDGLSHAYPQIHCVIEDNGIYLANPAREFDDDTKEGVNFLMVHTTYILHNSSPPNLPPSLAPPGWELDEKTAVCCYAISNIEMITLQYKYHHDHATYKKMRKFQRVFICLGMRSQIFGIGGAPFVRYAMKNRLW